MTCRSVRKTLLERSTLELLTPDLAQANAHLEQCPQCQAFLKRDETLRRFVKDSLGREKAPATVREGVLRAIAQRRAADRRQRPKRQFDLTKTYVLAAAVVLVIGIFFIYHYTSVEPGKQASALATELIDDHIRYRLSGQPAEMATAEPTELTRWFSSRLDFGVQIPQPSGVRLVGGRLCYLFDRRVALVFYQQSGQWVSLFLLRGEYLDLSALEKVERERKVLYRSETKGYQVVAWREKGLVYALVSDRDVLELALSLK